MSQDRGQSEVRLTDVRVVDLGREADLGGLEGVVGGESDGKEEDATGVR